MTLTSSANSLVGVETEKGERLCRPSCFCVTLCFAQMTDRAQVLYFFAPPAATASSHGPPGVGRPQDLLSALGQMSREAFLSTIKAKRGSPEQGSWPPTATAQQQAFTRP